MEAVIFIVIIKLDYNCLAARTKSENPGRNNNQEPKHDIDSTNSSSHTSSEIVADRKAKRIFLNMVGYSKQVYIQDTNIGIVIIPRENLGSCLCGGLTVEDKILLPIEPLY